MSRLPFTDSHVHFFDMREKRLRYSWLEPGGDPGETAWIGEYGAMRSERYHVEDFLAETRFQNVDRIIHVQAALGTEDPVDETRWLQAFHDRLGVPHAIIGDADLTVPHIAEVIDRHRAFPIFRGVRDLRYDGAPGNAAWENGYALLGKHRLICCGNPKLEHAADFARLTGRHPDVTFCVDHALFPLQRDKAYFDWWHQCLRQLAAIPTNVMKISGLGMCDHGWTVASIRPWVLACIEAFGVERSFFGTNWPVDRLYSSYGDVLDAYAEIIAGVPGHEQEMLFSGNANRIFRACGG
jgi:predicted TIM-barrel fold metal-dependent hydrolase